MQLWIVEHFHLHKKVPVLMNHNTWKNHMLWFTDYGRPVRKSSSLHSPKPTPTPKIFWVRPKHILSATLAQIFRFLWFTSSMGVRTPCIAQMRQKLTAELSYRLWCCQFKSRTRAVVPSLLYHTIRTDRHWKTRELKAGFWTLAANFSKIDLEGFIPWKASVSLILFIILFFYYFLPKIG